MFTVDKSGEDLNERIDQVKDLIAKEDKNPYIKKKLEDRLAILSGSVAVIKVGADSKVELKEKKDRVEDAIHATKAALKEGIVPGGGVAWYNASKSIKSEGLGEEILLSAITKPMQTILENAGLTMPKSLKPGQGLDVVSGDVVDMIEAGVVDPVLVTKAALKNAISVVSTIISADCVINNMRTNESS